VNQGSDVQADEAGVIRAVFDAATSRLAPEVAKLVSSPAIVAAITPANVPKCTISTISDTETSIARS